MTDRTKHFLTTDLIPIPRSVTIGDGAFITLEDGLKLTLQIPETAGAEKILNDDAFLFWKIRFNFFSSFFTVLVGVLAVIVHKLHILHSASDNFSGIFCTCPDVISDFFYRIIVCFAAVLTKQTRCLS